MRNGVLLIAFLVVACTASAQGVPAVFIEPTGDGFETFVTAAIHKKKVPVTVTTNALTADFTLDVASVEVSTESTGSKVVRCLFAYCAGIEDKASTSVTLTSREGVIDWSYAVNKGRGAKNRQSMAEAIAKHMNNHFKQKAKAEKDARRDMNRPGVRSAG